MTIETPNLFAMTSALRQNVLPSICLNLEKNSFHSAAPRSFVFVRAGILGHYDDDIKNAPWARVFFFQKMYSTQL